MLRQRFEEGTLETQRFKVSKASAALICAREKQTFSDGAFTTIGNLYLLPHLAAQSDNLQFKQHVFDFLPKFKSRLWDQQSSGVTSMQKLKKTTSRIIGKWISLPMITSIFPPINLFTLPLIFLPNLWPIYTHEHVHTHTYTVGLSSTSFHAVTPLDISDDCKGQKA